ncbi:META domain-containing protein [Vibrio cidicii]|uniref:META domain-containing protein n=1 Tax=Vibrio cidicii TaxID=1763883 RepID=UPI003752A1E7
MKLSSKTLLPAISLPLLLSACVSQGNSMTSISAQDLQHHHWQLSHIDGKALEENESTLIPRLEIGENLTANGFAGCNQFFGQAELKGTQLRIEKMGMTMKMCHEEQMHIEQVVSGTLTHWSEVTLTNETLTLKSAQHELVFTQRDWVN